MDEVEVAVEEVEEEEVLLPCSDLASCSFSFKLTRWAEDDRPTPLIFRLGEDCSGGFLGSSSLVPLLALQLMGNISSAYQYSSLATSCQVTPSNICQWELYCPDYVVVLRWLS